MVSDSVFLWCVCVSLLCFFSYVFFSLYYLLFFLKREKEGLELEGQEVERIWEKMKERVWSDYTV